MSQSSPPLRVKGGLPWWLWVLLSFATIAVVAGVAISSTPDNPKTLFDEAIEDLSGDPKTVRAKLEKLRTFDDYKWHAQYVDGMLAFREMRDPRALKLLAEIPDDHELKPQAMKQMGDSYRRTRRYKESMDAYQKAIALSPDTNVDARVSLSGMYLGIGAHQLAEEVLNEAIAKDPTQPVALESRAISRTTEQRYPEALEDFRKILSTPGEFSAATPDLLTSYGNAILKVGDKDLIQNAVDEHLSLFEETAMKMALLIAVGQLDEAEAAARMEEGPGSVADLPQPVQKQMARIEIERGEWEKAEKIIRPLTMIMPRDVETFEMAARVYKETDDTARQTIAEENVKQLKQLNAELMAGIKSVGNNIDDADGRAAVARLYMKLADFSSAIRWFGVAVTLDEKYNEEMAEASSGVTYPRTPLVEFPSEADDANTAPAADESDKADKAKEPKEDEAAEPDSEPPSVKKPAKKDEPAKESPPESEAADADVPAKSDEESDAETNPAP